MSGPSAVPTAIGENVESLRTDSVVAQETRDGLGPLLRDICVIMDRARAAGLIVSFNINVDQYGRNKVTDINIVKPL